MKRNAQRQKFQELEKQKKEKRNRRKNIKSDVWFAGVDTTAKEILSQSSNEKDEQESHNKNEDIKMMNKRHTTQTKIRGHKVKSRIYMIIMITVKKNQSTMKNLQRIQRMIQTDQYKQIMTLDTKQTRRMKN